MIQARPSGFKELNLAHCPHCGKAWNHAYYNVAKEMGYCFYCLQVISAQDIGPTPPYALRRLMTDLERRTGQSLLDAVQGIFDRGAMEAARKPPLPPGLITQFDQMPAWIQAYARKRVPQWFLDLGDRIGWTDYVPDQEFNPLWRYRMLLLTRENGAIVQWTGRAVYDTIKPKYYNPTLLENPISISSTVFNLDLCEPGAHILVCEGPLSAVSLRGGVAVMGASVSAQQAARIVMAKPSRITLFWEWKAPPTGPFRSVSNLLRAGANEVFLARLGPADPNDDPDGALDVAQAAIAVDSQEIVKLEVAANEWKRMVRSQSRTDRTGGAAGAQTVWENTAAFA